MQGRQVAMDSVITVSWIAWLHFLERAQEIVAFVSAVLMLMITAVRLLLLIRELKAKNARPPETTTRQTTERDGTAGDGL